MRIKNHLYGDFLFVNARTPEMDHSNGSNRFGVVVEKFVANFKARRVQLVNGDVHAKRHGQRLQLESAAPHAVLRSRANGDSDILKNGEKRNTKG